MKNKNFTTILKKVIQSTLIIIWATLPITFITTADIYQEITPTYIKWMIALLIILFTLISMSYFYNYYKNKAFLKIQKIHLKDIFITIGLFLILRLIAIIGTLLNEYATGNTMTSNDAAVQTTDSLATFPLYLLIFNLIIAIAAPILEELAFRGIFINIWFKHKNKILPGLITSIVFSIAHGHDNLITFSMYFFMGMILFFAYCRRWNIKDSILLHVLNNGFIVLFPYIFG
ncbi:hypothetical protein, CAAX protease family (plasmid) [Carnobacterium sp. 17-4]|uniref:CPBP family intramembrane glutamic endopeptidase n=1 Tax=Carnobacterium sp. (strain 17-4) TaxID=208596 RepID=UPI00020584A4|nr:type II CAAX endopeptidase family protein [Carnobacterium sp. 17-4]AEB31214.1 hypothetical protein, CAAX protease family [Carnobacterium sp. 17-4]